MQFNLKSLFSILVAIQAAHASAEPHFDSHPDVKIIYTTVTVWDHPIAIPTGIEFEDDDENHTYPLSSQYSKALSSAYPSFAPTTLDTVYVSSVSSVADQTETPVADPTTKATTTEATTVVATTAAAQSTTQNSVFDTSVHNGIATFYSVSADNCGTFSTDNDFVCAISQQMYNTLANSESISEYCGHMINITYNNKTIKVKVVDSCASCDANHLDLSPAAFNSLANPDLGVIDIQWTWA